MTFRYKLACPARRDLQEISDYWTAEAGEEVALKVIIGDRVRKFPAGQYMLY